MGAESMKITIVSGKGGVGKSSVVASLAVALRGRVVVVDADADCPNQHLLFVGKEALKKPLYASHTAEVDYSKCVGCGACRDVCKFGAMPFTDKPKIDPLFCEGCGACKIVCPQGAITLKEVESGVARVVQTNEGFPLIYGKLHPGKSGSGKLVQEVREMASDYEKEFTLIDGAAGIGCPVIASIMGVDYVIGVVEPTPSSISDLERMLETTRHFKVPYGIVINKVGLSAENEEAIRKKFGPILAEIPYDPSIPRLLAERKPLYYASPEIKNIIIDIIKKLEALKNEGNS